MRHSARRAGTQGGRQVPLSRHIVRRDRVRQVRAPRGRVQRRRSPIPRLLLPRRARAPTRAAACPRREIRSAARGADRRDRVRAVRRGGVVRVVPAPTAACAGTGRRRVVRVARERRARRRAPIITGRRRRLTREERCGQSGELQPTGYADGPDRRSAHARGGRRARARPAARRVAPRAVRDRGGDQLVLARSTAMPANRSRARQRARPAPRCCCCCLLGSRNARQRLHRPPGVRARRRPGADARVRRARRVEARRVEAVPQTMSTMPTVRAMPPRRTARRLLVQGVRVVRAVVRVQGFQARRVRVVSVSSMRMRRRFAPRHRRPR